MMSPRDDAPPSISQIFALGPPGTFSDQAARRVERSLGRRGHAAGVVFTPTVRDVFRRTAIEAHTVGVVPIENSSIGTVAAAREGLLEHDVVIESELEVRVRFRLLANAPLPQVTRVFTHPASHEQCATFLGVRLPNVAVTFTHSNTDSGDRLRSIESGARVAAIVPVAYGDDVPELIVADDIQDDPENTTRFLVVRRREEARAPDFSRNKASFVIDPRTDRPGLLHEILSLLKQHDVNLCRIESRPARSRPWAYVFHMDIHQNSHGREVLAALEANGWGVRLLGTFDALPEDTGAPIR